MMYRRLLRSLIALSLFLSLAACGAVPKTSPEESAQPETLETLCGKDYQTYLTETIHMQMENRMEKTPEVRYFPITENAPLTDYAVIDETTDFQVDEEGNIIVSFPAGTVTDSVHGEQTFTLPCP